MLEQFLALSRILTGVGQLDAALANQYLDRLVSTPFGSAVRQMLERFAKFKPDETLPERVTKEIVDDDTLRPAVCQIILLWYTSALWDNGTTPIALRYGTQDEYFSGLAWSLIGAHPPGLSGGYFGHWRYRPENEPKVTPP
jgi:hypothetical protein